MAHHRIRYRRLGRCDRRRGTSQTPERKRRSCSPASLEFAVLVVMIGARHLDDALSEPTPVWRRRWRFVTGSPARAKPAVSSRRPRARPASRCARASREGGAAGQLPGVPGAGGERDRDVEVRGRMDQAEFLRALEDRPDSFPSRRDHPRLVASSEVGVGAVLQHRADQRESARSETPRWKWPTRPRGRAGDLGGHLGSRVLGRLQGRAGQACFAGPAAVESLTGGLSLLGDGGEGHGLVADCREVLLRDGEDPGIDGWISHASAPPTGRTPARRLLRCLESNLVVLIAIRYSIVLLTDGDQSTR